MANTRMDQRKLSRLLKAVIDQASLDAELPQPISVGARDLLAQSAAMRLFRQRFRAKDLPALLADAAGRLPEAAKRIGENGAATVNRRRDRIDAAQVRSARKAGVLGGLDPWG
jgi:hypothetical protein